MTEREPYFQEPKGKRWTATQVGKASIYATSLILGNIDISGKDDRSKLAEGERIIGETKRQMTEYKRTEAENRTFGNYYNLGGWINGVLWIDAKERAEYIRAELAETIIAENCQGVPAKLTPYKISVSELENVYGRFYAVILFNHAMECIAEQCEVDTDLCKIDTDRIITLLACLREPQWKAMKELDDETQKGTAKLSMIINKAKNVGGVVKAMHDIEAVING